MPLLLIAALILYAFLKGGVEWLFSQRSIAAPSIWVVPSSSDSQKLISAASWSNIRRQGDRQYRNEIWALLYYTCFLELPLFVDYCLCPILEAYSCPKLQGSLISYGPGPAFEVLQWHCFIPKQCLGSTLNSLFNILHHSEYWVNEGFFFNISCCGMLFLWTYWSQWYPWPACMTIPLSDIFENMFVKDVLLK